MDIKPCKFITCVLPKGKARGLLKILKSQKGIITADFNSARGLSAEFVSGDEQEQTVEKDILQVIVPVERASEIFTFIYREAGIGETPNSGFMFQGKLSGSLPYFLPECPEEE